MPVGRSLAAGLAIAFLFAVPLPGETTKASAEERKTLSRTLDPVIVSGAQLAALPTRETARLRLHRFDGGHAVDVPYQFDPRDARGDVAVDGPADFELDDNDELVFMAKDAGDRADAEPCERPCAAAVEIEVVDPVNGEKAWVYLTAESASAPRATFKPYVEFDASGRVAQSPYYRVEYAPDRNYFTGLSVASSGSGPTGNLLRRSSMRGSPTFSLFVTEVTLDFTEQNSLVQLEGVRSGPVRAVRRARLSVDLGSLFPELPSGIAYTYHYLTSYETPTHVSFPWIMLESLRDFRFEETLEFRPTGAPLRYYDADHPGGVSLVDGAGEIRTTRDHDWWVHSNDAGAMLHSFVIPERWREWGVVRGGIVRSRGPVAVSDVGTDGDGAGEGARSTAPGPSVSRDASGRGEAAGYTLLNMTKLQEAGTYDLEMASIVLPRSYRAGDEKRPLEMLRAPLATTVRRVR